LPRSNTVEQSMTYLVSTNYFSVLGVRPIQGRTFEELSLTEITNTPVALISENYWRKRFDSDPAILGKSVRLNAASFTVIGIMPRDFIGTNLAVPAFWLPLSESKLIHPGTDWMRERETNCCRVFGRLRDGVTLEQAQAEMTRVANNQRSLHDPHTGLAKPVSAVVWRGSPFPFPLQKYAGLRYAIGLIMAAVGMVLVIACANVASLQLARATARQHELSTRLALGASRGRLIRQLLTESALLGLIAGALALMCSWGLLQILVKLIADAFPSEYGTFIFHVTPDLEVFAYVSGLSVGASLLFGLAPALESSRVSLSPALKGSTGTAPGKSRRLRNVLLGTQVAVSLVLMIAGSMLIRSSVRALTMETGYDVKHVLQVGVRYPEGGKYSGEGKKALARELRQRMAGLPEVGSITVANAPDDNEGRLVDVALGGAKPSERNTRGSLTYTFVEGNYFETLGIPMRSGRGFTTRSGKPENTVIVSESAAAELWPGQNPVGQRVGLSTARYPQFHNRGDLLPDGTGYVVVGVAGDVRGVAKDGSDSKEIYVPMPEDRMQDYPILIKMLSDPNHFVNGVGPVVAGLDPDLMVYSWTLEDMLRQTEPFIASSMAAAVAVTVGGLGLLLASMGIYGTVSYIVVLRTREVGIRMALGAQKRHILAVMLRESTRPVVAGLVVGMGLSIGVSFVLRGVLYRASSVDAVSVVGVSMLFLGIALFAAYLPSRRAMRVDPIETLRYE
jgi:predicted permease